VARSISTTSCDAQPVTVRRPDGDSARPQGDSTPDEAGNTTRLKTQLAPLSAYSSTRCEPLSAISMRVDGENRIPAGSSSPVPITVVGEPPAVGKRSTRWTSESVAKTCAPRTATPQSSATADVPTTESAPPGSASRFSELVVSARSSSGSAKKSVEPVASKERPRGP
jgi:hypothetical protein